MARNSPSTQESASGLPQLRPSVITAWEVRWLIRTRYSQRFHSCLQKLRCTLCGCFAWRVAEISFVLKVQNRQDFRGSGESLSLFGVWQASYSGFILETDTDPCRYPPQCSQIGCDCILKSLYDDRGLLATFFEPEVKEWNVIV